MKTKTKAFIVAFSMLSIFALMMCGIFAVKNFEVKSGGTIEFIAPGISATISSANLSGMTKKATSGQMSEFSITKDMSESQITELDGYKSWSNISLLFDVGLMVFGLALEVEEILDLLSHGGHDGGVEKRIETAEQESTDNNGDQNLDTGIDVAFGADVVDCTLSTDSEHVALFGNLVKYFFIVNTSYFLLILIWILLFGSA